LAGIFPGLIIRRIAILNSMGPTVLYLFLFFAVKTAVATLRIIKPGKIPANGLEFEYHKPCFGYSNSKMCTTKLKVTCMHVTNT
jgi:hypothetical protein